MHSDGETGIGLLAITAIMLSGAVHYDAWWLWFLAGLLGAGTVLFIVRHIGRMDQ